jgi:hypothetical protein
MRTTKSILATVVVALLATLATTDGTEAQELRFERAPTNTFKVNCEPRPPKPIDPILYYGQTNSSHLHAPFGGVFDPYSDYRYLRAHGTTCNDDEHKSLYWNPTAERETTGKRIPATDLQAYYRAVKGTPTADLRPPPRGVKLIAGFGTATKPQYGVVDWGCGSRVGQPGGADGRKDGYLRPVDCDPNSSNPLIKAVIHFPNCFTGAIDSSDHRSHAAYPVGYPEDPAAWRCPDGYPIRSPRLDYSVRFATSDADNLALSSGPPESMHADWIHAANQARFQALIDAKLAGG